MKIDNLIIKRTIQFILPLLKFIQWCALIGMTCVFVTYSAMLYVGYHEAGLLLQTPIPYIFMATGMLLITTLKLTNVHLSYVTLCKDKEDFCTECCHRHRVIIKGRRPRIRDKSGKNYVFSRYIYMWCPYTKRITRLFNGPGEYGESPEDNEYVKTKLKEICYDYDVIFKVYNSRVHDDKPKAKSDDAENAG